MLPWASRTGIFFSFPMRYFFSLKTKNKPTKKQHNRSQSTFQTASRFGNHIYTSILSVWFTRACCTLRHSLLSHRQEQQCQPQTDAFYLPLLPDPQTAARRNRISWCHIAHSILAVLASLGYIYITSIPGSTSYNLRTREVCTEK